MPAHALGESCLLWRLGRGPTPANAARVHRLYQRLNHALATGRVTFRDAVPAYDSLAVHFDPLTTDAEALRAAVQVLLDADIAGDDSAAQGATSNAPTPPPTTTITLPVTYDGIDLQRVADHTHLGIEEVARRHTAPTYVVAAIGFLPHFPYLLGLDPALATPRRAAPRTRVPAGAVAIGNDQTGVYPCESPGGWNLIGTADPARLVALRPGHGVRFENATQGACAAHSDPPRLRLNIDLGERGADHPTDHALAAHADLINLACGGHAGDAASVAQFIALAQQHGARLTAHLSYPDREHFGRRAMPLSFDDLTRALDTQRTLLPEPNHVKLHGALYHAADTDPALAAPLARWLQHAGFTTVLTPDPGALAHAARERGLAVLAEAFVERRYHRAPLTHRVGLLPRTDPAASLTTLTEALAQADRLIADRTVALYPDGATHRMRADTLCVHSDSPIALDLAAALAARLREGARG